MLLKPQIACPIRMCALTISDEFNNLLIYDDVVFAGAGVTVVIAHIARFDTIPCTFDVHILSNNNQRVKSRANDIEALLRAMAPMNCEVKKSRNCRSVKVNQCTFRIWASPCRVTPDEIVKQYDCSVQHVCIGVGPSLTYDNEWVRSVVTGISTITDYDHVTCDTRDAIVAGLRIGIALPLPDFDLRKCMWLRAIKSKACDIIPGVEMEHIFVGNERDLFVNQDRMHIESEQVHDGFSIGFGSDVECFDVVDEHAAASHTTVNTFALSQYTDVSISSSSTVNIEIYNPHNAHWHHRYNYSWTDFTHVTFPARINRVEITETASRDIPMHESNHRIIEGLRVPMAVLFVREKNTRRSKTPDQYCHTTEICDCAFEHLIIATLCNVKVIVHDLPRLTRITHSRLCSVIVGDGMNRELRMYEENSICSPIHVHNTRESFSSHVINNGVKSITDTSTNKLLIVGLFANELHALYAIKQPSHDKRPRALLGYTLTMSGIGRLFALRQAAQRHINASTRFFAVLHDSSAITHTLMTMMTYV